MSKKRFKKKEPTKYYAVAGLGGYGIFTKLPIAEHWARYPDHQLKEFVILDQAKIWARETFYSSQKPSNWYITIESIEFLNFYYHRIRARRKPSFWRKGNYLAPFSIEKPVVNLPAETE